MSNDYPFSPYPDPFSPLTPPPAPEPPRAQPAAWPAPQMQEELPRRPSNPAPFPSATPQFSPPPALTSEVDIPEPPAIFSDEDTDDNAVQKTALAIVAGVLVVLILIGFGIWYFLRDKGQPALPYANLILAAAGGKITTPEGAALIVPPGALSQDTRLEIVKVTDGDVTDLFELKPLGQKFLKPVTVEIPYKKSGPIVLEYWKEEGEKRVLRYTRDEKEKKLRTQVREF